MPIIFNISKFTCKATMITQVKGTRSERKSVFQKISNSIFDTNVIRVLLPDRWFRLKSPSDFITRQLV